MSPFLFLLGRRIKNGVLRSFKTPMRAAMTILAIAYFVFTMFLFASATSSPHPHVNKLESLDPRIPLAILTLFHGLLLSAAIPSPKYMYMFLSETDIANIYPTPLRRWKVFRFFLFTRALLGMLLFSGLGAFYGFFFLRLAMPDVLPKMDHGIDVAVKVAYGITLAAAIGGLLFWRIVIDLWREFKLIPEHTFRNFMIAISVLMAGAVLSRIPSALAGGVHPLIVLAGLVDSVPFSTILAPIRQLALLFLGRMDLGSASFWISVALWHGLAITGYRTLRSQGPLLYGYAASVALFRTQMAERVKNPALLLKEKTEKRKGTIRLPWFLRYWSPRKGFALLWRDAIVSWRSLSTVVGTLQFVLVVAVVGGWIAAQWFQLPVKERAVWAFSVFTMSIAALPLSMVSIVGIAEILQKVEAQKPLPIRSLDAVTMHILQWTLLIASVSLPAFVFGVMFFHAFWFVIVFVLILGWSFNHVVISGYFWIALYNPDQQDPIQKLYGGLYGLLVAVAVSIPGIIAVLAGFLLHAPLAATLFLGVSFNGASATMLHYLSSRKYVNFVFTE
jgi:hypothetical protein